MARNEDLSQRAKALRVALGETQEQFARRVGVHRVTVANVERGTVPVSRKIAAYVEQFGQRGDA